MTITKFVGNNQDCNKYFETLLLLGKSSFRNKIVRIKGITNFGFGNCVGISIFLNKGYSEATLKTKRTEIKNLTGFDGELIINTSDSKLYNNGFGDFILIVKNGLGKLSNIN